MFVDCETTERLFFTAAVAHSKKIFRTSRREKNIRYPAMLVNNQTKHQIDLLHIHIVKNMRIVHQFRNGGL